MRRQNAYAGTACNDIVSVDRASLQLPGMLSMLDQRVRFYRSQIATQNIVSFIGSATVPGLGANTVADVLQALRNGGCPVFIYGGVVRDQFLERTPNDVDTEVDCSISTVVTICKTQWGEQNCGRDMDVITHIGTQSDPNNVDLAPTGKTFYAPLSDLEYTANSLAYDTNGNDVIIDLPGNGVDDVCLKEIRIPNRARMIIQKEAGMHGEELKMVLKSYIDSGSCVQRDSLPSVMLLRITSYNIRKK